MIAAGFDGWKRDQGEQSLRPEDPVGDGSRTALSRYFLGDDGGLSVPVLLALPRFSLYLLARSETADIRMWFETSGDLQIWQAAGSASRISSQILAGERESSRWELDLPADRQATFVRCAFTLK